MESVDQHPLIPFALALLIVLYPVLLSDPLEIPVQKPVEPRAAGVPGTGKTTPASGAKLSSYSGLDRAAFLLAFQRQAGEELIPCVAEARGPRGSVTMLARINKKGDLSALRFLDPAGLQLPCAVEAIEKMNFAQVAKSLKDDTLEISWRLDW